MAYSYEYTRLDALSDEAYAQLTDIAATGLPDEWRFSEPRGFLWLVATLVDERPACMMDVKRQKTAAADWSDCPIQQFLDTAEIPYIVETYDRDHCELRHFALSPDPDRVEIFREYQPDTDPVEIGTALGYPESAIEWFVTSEVDSRRTKLIDHFIWTEMDVAPADARYRKFAPYVPAPTAADIRQAIATGKRLEALRHQLSADRPAFEGMADRCGWLPSVESWVSRTKPDDITDE